MKKESILLAIEAIRQSVQEDAHIYFYPSIPEEVLNRHKKSYLDLEPDEDVLCLVNKGNKYISMGFFRLLHHRQAAYRTRRERKYSVEYII